MKLPLSKKSAEFPFFFSVCETFQFYVETGDYGCCRDDLQHYLLYDCIKSDRYFFVPPVGVWLENGIDNVKKIESTIRLKRSYRAKFSRVKNKFEKEAVLVELGKFWGANSLRISIFTALLKNKDYYFNINDAAKKLLELFLRGYTLPNNFIYDIDYGFIDNLLRSEPKGLVCKSKRKPNYIRN